MATRLRPRRQAPAARSLLGGPQPSRALEAERSEHAAYRYEHRDRYSSLQVRVDGHALPGAAGARPGGGHAGYDVGYEVGYGVG